MQTTALLPAAPLADATDALARSALQALLQDPKGAGVPNAVVELVAKTLLGQPDAERTSIRGLPHRVRVPVASPYVLTLEEVRAMASLRLCESRAETRSAPPRVAAAAREAGQAAKQTARETAAAPQFSWALRPIAVPGTPWGECAKQVVWQRAQDRVTRRWVPAVGQRAGSARAPATGRAGSTGPC